MTQSDGGKARPATLHDVANAVGVSPRIVSRVVNREGGFSDATRQRVLDAIDELGYQPNVFARGLITQRSRTIGFVAPELDDPFFPELVEGVHRAARREGLTTLVAVSEGDPATEHEVLSQLAGFRPDGVILFPVDPSENYRPAEVTASTPLVLIDPVKNHDGVVNLRSDLAHGARLAVDRLVELGCTKLQMLANANVESSTDRREQGFLEAARRHGIPATVTKVAATIRGGEEGAALIAADADGVFCYNDVTAIGAMRRLQTLGRRVPDDVAVIGFDDIEMGSVVTPQLTTIRIDRERLGATAVEELLAVAAGRTPGEVLLDVSLVIRQSG